MYPHLVAGMVLKESAGADAGVSRVIHNLFADRYGPLVGTITEPTVNEFLKGFEANLKRAKGDVTLVAQELLDRAMPPRSRRRK